MLLPIGPKQVFWYNLAMLATLIFLYPFLFAQVPSTQPADNANLCRGLLKSPGGEIPFRLELIPRTHPIRAILHNGPERIELSCSYTDGKLFLTFDPYGSFIEATAEMKPNARYSSPPWKGVWKKPTGKDTWSQMEFRVGPYRDSLFDPIRKLNANKKKWPNDIAGRWLVTFKKDDQPQIAIFKSGRDGEIEGTILSTTGDYGYLTGSYEEGRLRLASFDGGHAFLFDARTRHDGTLAGDFWSRDSFHDEWTAHRDDNATLPDTFKITKAIAPARFSELKFTDLDGKVHSLDESALHGKARIIEVSGSWCPNCNDSANLLADLDRKYRARGLSIVGLFFEVTGDAQRDSGQVRKFAQRHKAEYPVFLAGLANKEAASKALPFVDGIKAFPTTIFLRGDGTVHAIDVGFSGPATGDEYQRLRSRYEAIIEELLSAKP